MPGDGHDLDVEHELRAFGVTLQARTREPIGPGDRSTASRSAAASFGRDGSEDAAPPVSFDQEGIMLLTTDQRRSRRSWYLAAAAVAAVLIGGLAFFAVDTDDEPPATDEAGTSAVTTTAGTEPVSTASVTTGRMLVAALDSYDAAATMTLLASDADVDLVGPELSGDVAQRVEWLAATGWRFDLRECRDGVENLVLCEVVQRNAWSEANGTEPTLGIFRFVVDGGRVTSLGYEFDNSTWVPDVWFAFEDFVRERSPVDHATMYEDDSAEPERVIELFAQYTDEYVAAQSGG